LIEDIIFNKNESN